jgi:hypothetical protein
MVHCGYEATAVAESVSRPWALLKVGLRGLRTTGPMSKDIPLDGQRPAEYVYTRHVADAMAKIAHRKPTPEDAEVEPAE